MRRLSRPGLALFLVVGAMPSALWGIPRADLPDLSDGSGGRPEILKKVGTTEKLGDPVPLDLPFVDSDGSPIALRSLFDGTRPVILTLNYSNCPRLCSLQLSGVFKALEKLDWNLGDKYRMITVSIDPDETPVRAQQSKDKYLTLYGRPGTEDGWHCLTGKEENIRKLADAVGFAYALVPETRQFAHTATTIVCMPDGRVSRYLYGIEYDPGTMRMALLEAGQGKIGTTAERTLLYCFAFDPQSGRYTLAAMRLVRAGGVIALVVLGGVLFVFWRREAKRSKDGTDRPE